MHLTHRFTPGLRFDSFWKYQTLTPSGRTHWAHLPLSTGTRDDVDPNGAWWCSRRCAAVLLRRPWQAMHMPAGLPAQPGAAEVARVLEALLPGWEVAQPDHGAQAPVTPCTQALDRGGSALLLLQSSPRHGRLKRTYWAWVVGVELQEQPLRKDQRPGTRGGRQPHSRALLTVPFGWPLPWSAGYTARVQMCGPGLCHVDGIYGQWRESRCLAAIAVSPGAASRKGSGVDRHGDDATRP